MGLTHTLFLEMINHNTVSKKAHAQINLSEEVIHHKYDQNEQKTAKHPYQDPVCFIQIAAFLIFFFFCSFQSYFAFCEQELSPILLKNFAHH